MLLDSVWMLLLQHNDWLFSENLVKHVAPIIAEGGTVAIFRFRAQAFLNEVFDRNIFLYKA